MGNKSGSIRKATCDGITYDVAADANVSKTPKQTSEGVRHSGGNMQKVTLNPGQYESITLMVSPQDFETLEGQAEESDLTLSITLADGSTWRAVGFITLDNYESEENRVDVTMTPNSGSWDLFAS